jgi:hypothetical protein
VDPTQAIQIGKRVQAKYVVIVRQIRMQARSAGFFPKKTVLDMELQAQVINIETTDIAESKSYARETDLSKMDSQAVDPRTGAPQLDQSRLGVKYSETVKSVAKDFITNTATTLMPLETVVVDVSPTEVILAAGGEVGLAPGAEFEVMKVTGVLNLPDGKKVEKTARVARLRVIRVESLISYAQFVETFGENAAKDTAVTPSRISNDMVARFIPVAAPVTAKKK